MEKPLDTTATTPTRIDPASFRVWLAAIFSALALFWLPYKTGAAGNRVPIIVFGDHPDSQQAVVLLVISGFSTSVSALYSSNRPKLARFFRVSSAVILSCAGAVVLLAIFVF